MMVTVCSAGRPAIVKLTSLIDVLLSMPFVICIVKMLPVDREKISLNGIWVLV